MESKGTEGFFGGLMRIGLERIAKSCKFEEFPPFIQNCIKEFNIDFNTVDGLFDIMYLCDL